MIKKILYVIAGVLLTIIIYLVFMFGRNNRIIKRLKDKQNEIQKKQKENDKKIQKKKQELKDPPEKIEDTKAAQKKIKEFLNDDEEGGEKKK